MSGQQVGSLVGGLIGSYFGPVGYAIGSAIGGAIGGYVDPTVIKGPRLTDATAQTATDGIPIPFGFGTFPTSGNIIFASPLRERKKEDDGKGTGIVNVTYHYYRSYAIGICQGILQDDGTYLDIAGILQVKRNGKIVYSTLPSATSEQLAQNSKFTSKARFYLGGETQLPSAMMESFKGAGNVPAYLGLVYMEVEDEELTDMGGAIPQYDFVVVCEGEVAPYYAEELAPGHLAEFVNADYILAESEASYELIGYRGGVEIAGDSVGEILQAFSTSYPTGVLPDTLLGYKAYEPESSSPAPSFPYSRVQAQPSIENNQFAVMIYNDLEPVYDILNWAPNFCPLTPNTGPGTVSDPYGDAKGVVAWRNGDGISYLGYPVYVYCVGDDSPAPAISGPEPVMIEARRKRVGPTADPPPFAVAIPDAPGYYTLPTGEVVYVPQYVEVFGTYKVLCLASAPTVVDNRFQFAYYEHGPALAASDPNYSDAAFWTGHYNAAVAAGTLPAGWTYGSQYPQNPDSVWRSNVTDTEIINRDLIPVAQCVAAICKRAGLTEDDFDVSSVTDLVDGFKVATEGSGESFIAPLMAGFFFDAGEWDDKVWFIKRGGDVVAEITVADLCERDGAAIEETELQEVELLRKVNVKAMDPDAGFNVTTQTAERRTTLVKAKGEQTTEIPVVIDHATQARMADKKMKVAWSEVRRFGFSLPYTFPEYTVTDVIGLTDKKGRRQRVRLMEMGEEEGRNQIREAMLDRQSSYTSNVEGIAHNPPTDTSPGLIGPTNGVALNLPSLRTSDNVPGMYIGGHGYLSGWAGASVLLSVDGGVSYQGVGDIVDPTTMGIITADIDEDDEPIPVDLYSGTLSSITVSQVAARMNAFAIVTDGVAEVGQFQIADPNSSGGYDLSNTIRGALNTTATSHAENDQFVMIGNLKFLPLDISLAGRTLFFKFVSYGTSADDAIPVEVVFSPLFTSVTIEAYVNDVGDTYTDQTGSIYYRIS